MHYSFGRVLDAKKMFYFSVIILLSTGFTAGCDADQLGEDDNDDSCPVLDDSKSVTGPESINFDGNNEYLSIDSDVLTRVSNNDFSISFWAYKADSSDGTIIGFIGDNYDDYILLRENSQYPNFRLSNAAEVDTSWSGFRGQWTHVTVTYDDDTSTNKVYFDGELKDSNSGSGQLDISDENPSVGRDGRDQDYYEGHLDELRIYNRELNETEVQKLFNTEDISAGLVDKWPDTEIPLCDKRGTSKECISNSSHTISGQDFSIENVFTTTNTAVFQALNERASISVSNSTSISGIWKGSFKITSEDRTTVESGAQFKPEKGRIQIN